METWPGSITLPESWKFYASTLSAMIALAGLDFIGAMFAKEWAERGRLPMFLLGWISFSVLFFVYARILKVAELSTVTIGWIVFLQVGLLILDAVHYDLRMPWQKWAAIGVILVLQIYLIAAPNSVAAKSTVMIESGQSGSTGPAEFAIKPDPPPATTPVKPAPIPETRKPSRPLGPNAA